jgi:hypothetical protein
MVGATWRLDQLVLPTVAGSHRGILVSRCGLSSVVILLKEELIPLTVDAEDD